jgi:hypothetical protein
MSNDLTRHNNYNIQKGWWNQLVEYIYNLKMTTWSCIGISLYGYISPVSSAGNVNIAGICTPK